MAEGGFDERSPLLTHTNEDDDDVAAPTVAAPTDGNVSMGFTPGDPRANSTPAPRHTRMNTAGEDTFHFPDTPGFSTTKFAEKQLKNWYPDFDKNKIVVFDENNKLKIKLHGNKKFESLFIYDKSAKKYRLNGNIARTLKKLLAHPDLILCP